MTATPGQAARETFIAEAEPAPFGFTAWDELPDDLRGKWARIAQAAIAAQELHAAPGETASLDAAVQAAAEVLFRDYESQYSASHLTWADFADLARKTVEAAISASAKIVAEHGWTPPKPAPELDEQIRLAREDRDQLRKHVLDLAADLDASAAATRPSRKSSIESEIAIALRKAAEPRS